MCGVVGLIYERERTDLGRIAADLLRTLEYRGYDSTGAAVQGEGPGVTLLKGVGAPSVLADALGITELSGRVMCGQVRWATFGAVNRANAQPHLVGCKAALYGAHNGNVTNCDDLKAWLIDEGHEVQSDNDGEMVVHTIEHYFARELRQMKPAVREDRNVRRACMRAALVAAGNRFEGSYTAVIVDPESHTLWAVKAGSSLYFGVGGDDVGGAFAVASSDLSSVLRLTKVVVPMLEGELVEFDATAHRLYALRVCRLDGPDGPVTVAPGEAIERRPVRSRLQAKDIALLPPFETFMDQEISAQEQTCRNVVSLFLGGSEGLQRLARTFDGLSTERRAELDGRLEALRDEYRDERISALFHELVDGDTCRALLARFAEARPRAATGEAPDEISDDLASSEAGFYADLLGMARGRDDLRAVRLFDALHELGEVAAFVSTVARFVHLCEAAFARGGRLLVVCCGSSYNAARTAALFFNELARVELVPLLPGEFRERVGRGLRDGDLVVAISQSGETKDLIDVLDDVAASGRDVVRVALVNNVNSTIAEEKSDLVIPLRCGPEIAVPATKSFVNQMAVLYCLALALAESRLGQSGMCGAAREEWAAQLSRGRERLPDLPDLIRQTFDSSAADVEEAARLLYLRPSVHILAVRLSGLAREGALKVREVVLNHAEGFDASEFKHGPNTILGVNTVFGPQQVDALLRGVGETLDRLVCEAAERGIGFDGTRALVRALPDSVLSQTSKPFSLGPAEQTLFDEVVDQQGLLGRLYEDYPLVYLTGPEGRDVHLAVSQINTHKIRGSCTVLIAEESDALRKAVGKPPADNPAYRSVYVPLPRTDDPLMVAFSATVVLQRLALRMSLLKARYLDGIGLKDHGVHPDVPKNVSKSITVD